MKTMRYIYRQNENMWLGYNEEFPDYMTQGETPEELHEDFKDIYDDLSGSKIPYRPNPEAWEEDFTAKRHSQKSLLCDLSSLI